MVGMYGCANMGGRSSPSDLLASILPRGAGTPWILNGDMATLYPFLAFRLPRVEYVRRWLSVNTKHTRGAGIPEDNNFSNSDTVSENRHVASNGIDRKVCGNTQAESGSAKRKTTDSACSNIEEAVALDLALPESGIDPAKMFYLVLHGLNGGSAEVSNRNIEKLPATAKVML